ncbi:hypothetical protein QAD02_005135 [Eretmocerus hayati]|uniref:Uncharacterized protein n=1 Tax=Eretmocerus hayati TaxID=131215 RepID=A0ACC2NSN7_9HYME|nr:hypothetical protein QAD02_005135 [Eretmocerus hayati]
MSVKIVAFFIIGAALISVSTCGRARNEGQSHNHTKKNGTQDDKASFLDKIDRASANLSETDKAEFDGLRQDYVNLKSKVLNEIEQAKSNFTTKMAEAKTSGWEAIKAVKENEGATLRQKSNEGYGQLHALQRKIWNFIDAKSTRA